MRGTALVYSSHDRSPYLHREFIVERALQGMRNKRILFLPMSETVQNGSEMERQEFSWGTFRWYLSQFRQYGLEANLFLNPGELVKVDEDDEPSVAAADSGIGRLPLVGSGQPE